MCVGCEGLDGEEAIRAAFARVRGLDTTPCEAFRDAVNGTSSKRRRVESLMANPFKWWKARWRDRLVCFECEAAQNFEQVGATDDTRPVVQPKITFELSDHDYWEFI